jgi:hypothetical protein
MARSSIVIDRELKQVIGYLLPRGVARVSRMRLAGGDGLKFAIEGDAVPDAEQCTMNVRLDLVAGAPVRTVTFEAV